MHACGPSDVIVLEYSEGKLSVCYKHHLKSIYLHREEQARLNHFHKFCNNAWIWQTPHINGIRDMIDSSGPVFEADRENNYS